MPQMLKPGAVKVLSFDFAMTIAHDFANGYLVRDPAIVTKVNGNNIYRAGKFMESSLMKGTDKTLTESIVEAVKNGGRAILAASDALDAGVSYEISIQSLGAIQEAGRLIHLYCKRRDDKFSAMEKGGAALL